MGARFLAFGMVLCGACGQVDRAGEGEGTGGAGGSGGEDCSRDPDAAAVREAEREELPTSLAGELCSETDSIWLTFDGVPGGPVRAAIEAGLGAGSYTLTLLGIDEGQLSPVRTLHDTNQFQLDESQPQVVFSPIVSSFSEDLVAVKLQGPVGPVSIGLERPTLDPILSDCDGAYEQLPVETPPESLPAVLELELCNARDSRVFAIDVVGGEPVTVTLENPESILDFRIGIYDAGTADDTPLELTAGDNQGTMGFVAARVLSFTPRETGVAAIQVALGASRGEPFRLRIEQ